MEKIQEAIAKARAARAEVEPPKPVAAPALVAEAQVAQTPAPVGPGRAITDAWALLTPCTIDPARMTKAHVVTLQGGKDASPFDALRTKVIQTMRTNNWRRLAITSPTPGCGKSTVALNLAFSLARQSDTRTIMAELDMRRPSLAKALGVKVRRNYAEVLEGKADFADQGLRHGYNLAFALNAAAIRNPAELLHGAGVSGHLASIEARYAPDTMIFDMPPMLISDDMMAFAGHVDCVLLIAGAELTTIKEIDACERELASQTNLMGVVLNKCNFMGEEYGYDYYG